MKSELEIKAKAARLLTQESLKGSLIEGILNIAFQRIREAAFDGKFSITNPFYNAYPFPSSAAQESALSHLKSLGYKVTHHKNPDPEDPRGSDWDEVSWEGAL